MTPDPFVPSQERIVTVRGNGHLHDTMHAIIKRAGLTPWPRLWQTLRASCEKEWAMSFPQYAVSKWIGHSITVSGKHYANNVPDELFTKAADLAPAGDGEPAKQADEKAAQNPAHYGAETAGMAKYEKKKSPVLPGISEQCLSVPVAGGGFEPPTSGL